MQLCHTIATVLAAVALTSCLEPDSDAPPKPAGPGLTGIVGGITLQLAGEWPADARKIRLRTCPAAGEACAGDVREVTAGIDPQRATLKAAGIPVGETLFVLALLDGRDFGIGEGRVKYTVVAGEQTLPAVTIRITSVKIRIPVAPTSTTPPLPYAWSNGIGDTLGVLCGDCHNGSGEKDMRKALNLKTFPITNAAGQTLAQLATEGGRRIALPPADPLFMPIDDRMQPAPAVPPRWVDRIKAWALAGAPKDPISGGQQPQPAPANLLAVDCELREMLGTQVLTGAATIRLARGAEFFEAPLTLIKGAKYQMTYRLLGAQEVLLRSPPDVKQNVIAGDTWTEQIDFSGIAADGTVTIPVIVETP